MSTAVHPLKILIIRCQKTQREIAKALGISEAALSNYLKRRVIPPELEAKIKREIKR